VHEGNLLPGTIDGVLVGDSVNHVVYFLLSTSRTKREEQGNLLGNAPRFVSLSKVTVTIVPSVDKAPFLGSGAGMGSVDVMMETCATNSLCLFVVTYVTLYSEAELPKSSTSMEFLPRLLAAFE